MPVHADLEREFALAVLDSSAVVPPALWRERGATPARRFGVYRNNVYASLIDLLAARFPAVVRLVGEAFFRAMARIFVEREPPRSPVLIRYGEAFPAFIASFGPAASVPYLADMASLELAQHEAYHAPDAEPLPAGKLMETIGAMGQGDDLVLELHPSCALVRSSYPIVSILERSAGADDETRAELPAGGEDALVVRPELEVSVSRLPVGVAAFVLAAADGRALTDAYRAAGGEVQGCDLQACLSVLVGSRAVAGIDIVKEKGRPPERGRPSS